MSRLMVLLTVLCCLGAATAESLPADSALDAPVTLAVKGESLADTLNALQKQTGVRLQAARDIGDQKVTVFVDEKPLRKVMEGLALTLEYHWTYKDLTSGKIYEIWEDEKTRLKREDWYTKALAKAWEETDAALKHLSELRAMTPEQLAPLQDQLAAKFVKGDLEAYKNWNTVRHFRDDLNMGTVVGIYDTFSPEALQAFRSGMTLFFDSLSEEKEWLISEVTARQLMARDKNVVVENGETVPGESINLEIKSRADHRGVYVDADMTVRRRDSWGVSGIGLCQNLLSGACPLPANHLPQEGLTPPNDTVPPKDTVPPDGKVPLSEMKVSWTVQEIAEEASLPVEQPEETRAVANRSDILAVLHRKLGLQIIADYYSEWNYWQAAKDRPLKEVLASFETMYDHTGGRPCDTYSGADAEFLYMRAKDVRLCNAREIPNRLLRPWQAAYESQGCLGLNELGEIAQLSESQMPYWMDSEFMGIGEAPATSPVLRLYGLLTAKQRKEAFSGGTKVSAFTPAQRNALTALLPTQRSMRNAGQEPIVGIYKDGWRVDKDEPAGVSASTPVTVAMDDQTITEEYRYETKSGGGKSIRGISAKSIKEAWESIKTQQAGAKKENLIWIQSRRIKATVKLADGSSCEKSVDIPSRRPYSKVKPAE